MTEKLLFVPYDRDYFRQRILSVFKELKEIQFNEFLVYSLEDFQELSSQEKLQHFSKLSGTFSKLFRMADELVQMQSLIFAEEAETHLEQMQKGNENVHQNIETT